MTLVYPHTSIQSDLKQLINMGDTVAATAKHALDQYLQKKTFYTARIAELEAQLAGKATMTVTPAQSAPSSNVATASMPKPSMSDSSMPYPHTEVQKNIRLLRDSLLQSGSPERQERLDALAAVERDYMAKREWFTAARYDSNAEYVHTEIQANLEELEMLLEDSNSPRRQERLDLLENIRTEYLRKREWFETLPSYAGAS